MEDGADGEGAQRDAEEVFAAANQGKDGMQRGRASKTRRPRAAR